MEHTVTSSRSSSSKQINSKDYNEVELRRLLEEHLEMKRLKAEFGDIIDL